MPSLRPPDGPTGYAHPNCYLRTSQDCSEQISREHYVSRSVLKKLGQIVKISGVHWLGGGKSLETSIGNLTAKILCKRHNEALSPLDHEAGIFFEVVANVLLDLHRKTLSRKPIFHLVSGDSLELWMLKIACGHYFGIGAKDGVRLDQEFEIDLTKVEKVFFEREWDSRCGLYFKGGIGDIIDIDNRVSVSALLNEQTKRMAGIRVGLLGLVLELLFEAENTKSGEWTELDKHPTELVWRRGRRQHSIILTWPIGTPERSITLEEAPLRRKH